MKIAVVGPSSIPFAIGGVENLQWGLCDAINKKTKHQCELIKIPVKEHNFWDLIHSYYQFYKLDLSHFDAIITCKYPAWMTEHPNSIYYMAHRLRGLYDTYPVFGLPVQVTRGDEKIDQILDYMGNNPQPNNLDDFFKLLFELESDHRGVPQDYFAFPAPFIRRLVHYMDDFGMRKKPGSRYFAISDTVRKRLEYFPENAVVDVIYPPSTLIDFETGDYRDLFLVSRLDNAKRIDMLVDAMKYVKSEVNLYIAGTGPVAEQLREQAKDDKRIKFLGFLNDDEVERYYANCLAVPYFPYDEDYGLITIETMMHKKPVITTNDAGGPTEFVTNGETGFITGFNARAIAEKIDYFARHPEEARRMGENAYELVKNITWESTANTLLEDLKPAPPRKKLTLTSTFSIWPPQGGGQARIYYLYKELVKYGYNTTVLSYINADQNAASAEICSGVREWRIPKAEEHQRKEWNLSEKAKMDLGDIAQITLGGETSQYIQAIRKSIDACDCVIISHPYTYPAVKQFINGKPFIHESHNVEYELKRNMLPESPVKDELLRQIFDAEKECCEKASLILTVTEEDRKTFNALYGIPTEKIIVVPTGVSCSDTPFASVEQRLANKKALGLKHEKMALFMGSWHGPNHEACEIIFKIAKQLPDVHFLLMGSQCNYFQSINRHLPANVGLLGVLSNEDKSRVFSIVDMALNPMISGSGLNVKMFDYMSAGIPIITTNFGTRGIENKEAFIIAEPEEMESVIRDFDLRAQEQRVMANRLYAENTFDWQVIARPLAERINTILK